MSKVDQEIKEDRALNIQSKIHTWLCPPDPSTNYHKALAQRHQGSGQWFIRSCTYLGWKEGGNRTLWIRGIPGCGKTILTSTIIKDLGEGEAFQKPLYFYFDFGDVGKQTFDNMVRSLILQFSHINVVAKAKLQTLYEQHQNGEQAPSMNAVEQTLRRMLSASPQTPIILDAMDECTTREPLLKWLRDAPCRLILTSRHLEDISRALEGWLDNNCIIDAQGSEIDNDIAAYVQHQLQSPDSTLAKTWKSRPDILDKIETKIKQQANGMWAACQIQALETFELPNDLLKALESLPKTLSETYKRVLDVIPESDLEHSKRILSFLTYSTTPLMIREAADILAISFKATPKFHSKYRMPNPDRVLRFCSSLVALAEDGRYITLAHFSVKEYLTSNEDKGRFSNALRSSVAHQSITELLIAYLSSFSHCPEFPIQLESWGRSSLLNYGACYWFHHAKYVPESSKSTHQCIIEFLSNEKVLSDVDKLVLQDHLQFARRPLSRSRVGRHRPLYIACLRGLRHTARYLLEQGADVNGVGGFVGQPLRAACFMGHEEIAKLLIQWGAKVDAQQYYRDVAGTALLPAIFHGMEVVVCLLLERGANPNFAGDTSFSKQMTPPPIEDQPLSAASLIGSVEMVRALLRHGADVKYVDSRVGTALMEACYGGHTEVARLLIDGGATIDLLVDIVTSRYHIYYDKKQQSWTALMLACYAGHAETVELLINKGADVDLAGDGDTVLTIARSQGHKAVVQTLLRHGASTIPTEWSEALRNLYGGFYEQQGSVLARRLGSQDKIVLQDARPGRLIKTRRLRQIVLPKRVLFWKS